MNYKGIKDKLYTCRNCLNNFDFKGHSSNNIYCSISCTKEHKTKLAEERIEKLYLIWLAGKDLGFKNARPLIRKFLIKRDGYKCSSCHLTEWLGKEITLWCDHIDGNATNNKPANFRLVCPNCDSQSDTFGEETGEMVENLGGYHNMVKFRTGRRGVRQMTVNHSQARFNS